MASMSSYVSPFASISKRIANPNLIAQYSRNNRIQYALQSIADNLRDKIKVLNSSNVTPTLAVIDNCKNPSYIDTVAEAVGLKVVRHIAQSGSKVENLIYTLNQDDSVHGISVSGLKNFGNYDFHSQISPNKDADGRNPSNFSLLRTAREYVFRTDRFRFDDVQYPVPCKTQGVVELLDRLFVSIEGKEVLLLGSSSRFQLETSLLLTKLHGTVTVSYCDYESVKGKSDSMKALIKRSNIIICDDIGIEHVKDNVSDIKPEVVTAIVDLSSDSTDKQVLYNYFKPLNVIQYPPFMTSLMLARNTIHSAQKALK